MLIDIDKALKNTIVLLEGSEETLRRRSLHGLLNAADPEGEGFNTSTMLADASQPIEWTSAASTAPFLGDRRIVVVRNLLRCDDVPDKAVLANLPATALVILVADEESGDFDVQRKFETRQAKWIKLVNDAKGFVYPGKGGAGLTAGTLRTEAENLGKKLSVGAANLLMEMTGKNFSRALEELDKLSVYVKDREFIDERDISEVVFPEMEWNVFALTDAIFNGRSDIALEQLRRMISKTSKPENVAFQNILPNLSRQIRLVWQARQCLDFKGSKPIPDEVAVTFPSKNNLSTVSEWQRQKAFNLARRTSYLQLSRIFAIVSDTDCAIKGMLPSFSVIDTVEQMALKMVQTAKHR